MITTEEFGYILAILVGVSLGIVGSGGSILTVPILVYVMGIEPIIATAYSLFVVGTTSLVVGIQIGLKSIVDFTTVFIFGTTSLIAVNMTRAYLLQAIPEKLFSIGDFLFTKALVIKLLFAIVMIFVAIFMIRPCVDCEQN